MKPKPSGLLRYGSLEHMRETRGGPGVTGREPLATVKARPIIGEMP